MAQRTTIEWTDATWNPVRGCTKVSPGCKHCYAAVFAERWRGVRGHPYEQGFDLRLVPERLLDPLRWKKRRSIFVNSMSDLFHESVPDSYIQTVLDITQIAPWHTYQILTKRSERLRALGTTRMSRAMAGQQLWLGVSIEDRKHGLPRLVDLQNTPARRRFISLEPLLEDLGELDLSGIHWVIVGGESGAGARPMARSWVESVRRQCDSAKIPFFFKQWGGVRKKKAGRELDGKTYDARPSFPTRICPSDTERRRLIARGEALCERRRPGWKLIDTERARVARAL